EDWKQPFQKEYTERTVNQAFDKLLGLRADVERALEKVAPRQSAERGLVPDSSSVTGTPTSQVRPHAPDSTKGLIKAADRPATLAFEGCMEQIWEQLIAAPPSRGRSMTTIRLGAARLLMSSWEVAAFVSEDGSSAEDLRRAVVARALVTA